MKHNAKIATITFLMVALCSLGYSGVVTVQNIAFNLPQGTTYYISDGGGDRLEITTGGTADLMSYDETTVYDYYIENVMLTVTPCALINDYSVGGQAMASFADGGILTFSGDLMESGSSTILYSGTLLVGEITADGDVFALEETTAWSNQLSSGAMGLDGTAGFSSGITATNGDTFLIGEMALKFQFFTIGVMNFDSTLSSQVPSIHISAAIPEPATLALLGIGGLMMRRKKK